MDYLLSLKWLISVSSFLMITIMALTIINLARTIYFKISLGKLLSQVKEINTNADFILGIAWGITAVIDLIRLIYSHSRISPFSNFITYGILAAISLIQSKSIVEIRKFGIITRYGHVKWEDIKNYSWSEDSSIISFSLNKKLFKNLNISIKPEYCRELKNILEKHVA